MSTTSGDEGTHAGFFHRSLSPRSFERLRAENSDYFYKPKRGPSASKSNITITRPIKTFKTVTELVELLAKGNSINSPEKSHVDDFESPPLSKKFDDQKSTSHYSSFLSMDGGDLSSSTSTSSSAFSSRSNSSISTVAEQETEVVLIDELSSTITQTKISSQSEPIQAIIHDDDVETSLISSYHVPAIGLNVTSQNVHLVLLELYPQNVDYSTIVFQRHLISLILDCEHKDWSILNVDLRTENDQEGNFRLFTLTHEQFDHLLLRLQSFIRYNSSLASSFILHIALTGEQTHDYEMKISSHLNKINLNFDIIQYRAESYMIGLDFFRRKQIAYNDDEPLMNILNPKERNQQNFYPYILVHAEAASTFFYIVHSPTKYSLITSNNLSYKTYSNLFKLLQPGFDTQIDESIPSPYSFRRTPSISLDFTHQDLCQNCHHSSTNSHPSSIPLSSFTRLAQRYIPQDYSKSNKCHYIYRGWSNRRSAMYDKNITMYDVQTQTDDSFLEFSSVPMRSAMRRSLVSMVTMNLALTIKLISKLYPTVNRCILTGEFFQLETQAGQELTRFLQSMIDDNHLEICQFKREPLISALGCALPRVYFDVIDSEGILGNDCIS